MWTATVDVADAFYGMEMPEEWRHLLGLEPVKAGDLGIERLDGRRISKGTTLYPRLNVLPMGWTHALALCQRVLETAADDAGLPREGRFSDATPAANIGVGAHTEYVDNFLAFSDGPVKSDAMRIAIADNLRSKGLPCS